MPKAEKDRPQLKKKTLFPKEQQREDVQKLRQEWIEYIPFIDISRLLYLDETSINLAMTRLYGRAFAGERVVDYVPDVRFERYSLLSTMAANADMIPLVYSGTLNGDLFKLFIAQFVVPKLKPRDILIMDCLSVHKVKGISEMVEAVGANVVYLPPYSPDLNPIEFVWPEIKADLKKLKADTYDLICDGVSTAIDAVVPEHAINYFRNCYCGL